MAATFATIGDAGQNGWGGIANQWSAAGGSAGAPGAGGKEKPDGSMDWLKVVKGNDDVARATTANAGSAGGVGEKGRSSGAGWNVGYSGGGGGNALAQAGPNAWADATGGTGGDKGAGGKKGAGGAAPGAEDGVDGDPGPGGWASATSGAGGIELEEPGASGQ